MDNLLPRRQTNQNIKTSKKTPTMFKVVSSQTQQSSGNKHQQPSFEPSKKMGIPAADRPAMGTPWWLM